MKLARQEQGELGATAEELRVRETAIIDPIDVVLLGGDDSFMEERCPPPACDPNIACVPCTRIREQQADQVLDDEAEQDQPETDEQREERLADLWLDERFDWERDEGRI